MPKARLYLDGDNTGIKKEAREYSLTQDITDKLDSIDGVEASLQAEIDDLQDQINNLAARGRYLSTWNAATGLPDTNPQVSPYTYRAGDYYVVSTVGTTNYRPHGSSYTIGVASTDVETETLNVNDLYIFDGVQWIRQGSTVGGSVAWGTILGNLANQTDLQNALDNKANLTDVLTKTNITSYTPTADYHPTTKKYVDDNDVHIGTSAPTDNVVEGRLWYDTTNDVLKVWNGSAWVPTGKTYTAGNHIVINNSDVISTAGLQEELAAGDNITIEDICTTESDMKGPCPSGFHVPAISEWVAIKNVRTTLGGGSSDGVNFGIALKLPRMGQFVSSSIRKEYVGNAGIYWGAEKNDPPRLGYLSDVIQFHSSGIYPESYEGRAKASPVRPLKNTPVVPDNSWTMLYGVSISAGGIFWNSTEGLISLSGDGVTWITIADKNLGATVVWNDGDTLSQSNCGRYFQRGNNYGFPFDGPTSTSTTQVNTAGYGPGNYYYSDTFIYGNNDWSSPKNDNLWGGQTKSTFQDCTLTISANDTTYTSGDFDIKDLTDSTGLRTTWSGKQDKMLAGNNININGTTINARDTEYTEGSNITITCPTESDMKGPCPSGFHVPLESERQGVIDIMNALTFTETGDERYIVNLHMPMCGMRNTPTSISNVGQWRSGGMWLSSYATTGQDRYSARQTRFDYIQNRYTYEGYVIRPMKNSFVIPDNNWTVINGVLGGAGIFWNQVGGIISITSDGNTGYTIADKNLGATVVYNNGDTYSEANCGRYYQWGNNYGFPGIGNTETILSTTNRPSATGYGPGNYYYSDVFVVVSARTWTQEEPVPKNLRGGVSQGTRQDCEHSIISATDTTYTATDFDIKDLTDSTGLRTTWSGKQDALTAGSHINITSNVVSTRGLQEELVVGDNVTIVAPTEDNKKGPCPSGFHVPTMFDWEDLIDIWTTLGGGSTDGDGFGVALKLPKAGSRDYSNGTLSTQGVLGLYWTCNAAASDAINLSIMSNDINSMNAYGKADALPVRAFKNTSVTPDNTWTMLYGTSIVAGGIFWNNAEGLISLSSDGSNWKTIQDKNLGATTVWNNGDTLSEANCGKYYQWGNNYGFAGIGGTVSVSSTQVDASGYGPGNYYSSSSYIISNSDWSSVQNDNLWGGTRQGTWQSNPIISADVSLEYADEHGPVIPVYYYSGDFNNDITFNIVEAGEYRLYVKAYHGTTVDKTLTLTVDNVTVGTLTSNLIEHLNASINFTASAGSTAVLSVSSKTNFTIQEVYIEKVNIQSGYLTAIVN